MSSRTEKAQMQKMPDVILAPDGKPFVEPGQAVQYRKDAGLDSDQYVLKTFGDAGFILVRMDVTPRAAPVAPGPIEGQIPSDKIEDKKYYWVRFAARRGNEDPEFIHLDCSGLALSIEREKTIAIPGCVVKLAKDARSPKFTKRPGQPRQEVGWMERFPCQVLGEATEADYKRCKKPGSASPA
jgi:hypothetical protein